MDPVLVFGSNLVQIWCNWNVSHLWTPDGAKSCCRQITPPAFVGSLNIMQQTTSNYNYKTTQFLHCCFCVTKKANQTTIKSGFFYTDTFSGLKILTQKCVNLQPKLPCDKIVQIVCKTTHYV